MIKPKKFQRYKSSISFVSFAFLMAFCLASFISIFYYKTAPRGLTILLLISALLFFPRLQEVLNLKSPFSIKKPIFWIGIFVFITSINLMLQKVQGYDLVGLDGQSSYSASLEIFMLGIIWFFCGASIQYIEFNKSNIWSGVVVVFVSLLIYSSLGSGLVVSYANLNAESIGEIKINHLTAGDNIVILLLIGYAFASQRMKLFIAPVIILLLFSLGGRNALLTLTFAIFIFHIFRREFSNVFSILAPVVTAVIVIGIFFKSNEFNDDLVSRMLFSDGISYDASFVQRNQQVYESIANLPSQAPIGNASLIVSQLGIFGEYSHNIISVWQIFGFAPFLVLLFIILSATRYVFINLKKITHPLDEFAAIIFIYSVSCIFISRAINFPCLWLAIGYWLTRAARRPFFTTRDMLVLKFVQTRSL